MVQLHVHDVNETVAGRGASDLAARLQAQLDVFKLPGEVLTVGDPIKLSEGNYLLDVNKSML